MTASKKDIELKKHEPVQAVIMAATFESKLAPLTDSTPPCLLPLATRPILLYTIDCLKDSGVEEIFVYCNQHSDTVKSLLKENGFMGDESCGMSVTVITNEECRSFGDAMRDLDGKALLRHDFILVNGDSVFNIDLKPLLKSHKARCQIDKSASLSLVCKKGSPGHHLRTLDEELLLAVDPSNNKILHYQRAAGKPKVPLEIFDSTKEIEICFDLIDPTIAICTHAVPPLFADNFDLQSFDGFIAGIIENELLDNTIYLERVENGYAARAVDFLTYCCISKDVVERWLYPFVPDMSLGQGKSKHLPFKFHRKNVYKCSDLKASIESNFERNVILGSSCEVGSNSRLFNSSVGRRCKIGNSVVIENCILFDNVTVKDGARLSGCVLAQGVIVGSKAIVKERCVLAENVEIGNNVVIPEDTRLTSRRDSDGFSDDDDEQSKEFTNFGPKAYKYEPDTDDAESDVSQLVSNLWGMRLADISSESVSSEGSESDMDEDVIPDLMMDDVARLKVFHSEVFDSLQRGFHENLDAKNLIVEINSSRYAYNTTQSDVVNSVITSIFAIAQEESGGNSGAVQLFKNVKKLFGQFSPLLIAYCKSSMGQQDCLMALEDHCQEHGEFIQIAKNTVHALFEKDILTEEVVLKWFENEPKHPQSGVKLRKNMRPFIEWLQESEDEESD